MRITIRRDSTQRGMTLIELLVVVSIMMLLAVIAIPAMQPLMETRKIREAARSVNVFFGSARTHAIERRQVTGVWVERDPQQPQSSVLLYYANVPPPYAGDILNARLELSRGGVDGQGLTIVQARRETGQTSDPISNGIFRRGDFIRFDYGGPLYRIVGGTDAIPAGGDGFLDALPLDLRVDLRTGGDIPWPAGAWSRPVPFQILCQPSRSTLSPLRLSADVVIDLYESGTSGMPFEPIGMNPTSNRPVVVLFTPSGSIDSFYCWDVVSPMPAPPPVREPNWLRVEPTGPIHFLIGRRDRIPVTVPDVTNANSNPAPASAPAEDGLRNCQDLTNLWITINPQTGLVTTSENAATTGTFDYTTRTGANGRLAAFDQARRFAKESQTMGGR